MGLRTVLVVALAAALGWLLVRAVVTRRVPWISLGLVVALLVPLFVTERQWIATEQRLTAVARTVVPGAEGVHCQRFGEALTYAGSDSGHVQFDADGRPVGPAVLSYDTCRALSAYLDGLATGAVPDLDAVVAVHVLSHELEHLAGTSNEGVAECTAVQRDAATARLLGASRLESLALASRYWRDVYPRMPDPYTSRDCRPNGPLDLSPGDDRWP